MSNIALGLRRGVTRLSTPGKHYRRYTQGFSTEWGPNDLCVQFEPVSGVLAELVGGRPITGSPTFSDNIPATFSGSGRKSIVGTGQGNIFSASDLGLPTGSDALSICFWLQFGAKEHGGIFGYGDITNAVTTRKAAFVFSGGNIGDQLGDITGTNNGDDANGAEMEVDTWEHICFTWSGSTYVMYQTIDGAATEQTGTGSMSHDVALDKIRCGLDQNPTGSELNNSFIFDPRIYGKVLTIEEVESIADGTDTGMI